MPACLCACVWHKQETGLWPLSLPYGREALQNMPDRWRQPLTTVLPHLTRTRPSPASSSHEGARLDLRSLAMQNGDPFLIPP